MNQTYKNNKHCGLELERRPQYVVRFDDGEEFAYCYTIEQAKKIRSENNFRFISRSLHIYKHVTGGLEKIV